MLTAFLGDGKVVHASEYNPKKHGYSLFCIDSACRAPVIFVERSERAAAYFKTSGQEGYKHSPKCGFYEPMDVRGAIRKVEEYQQQILSSDAVPKNFITLNLKKLDPDYVAKVGNRNEEEQKKEDHSGEEKLKVKDKKETPATINSMKSVVNLLTSYEPDTLSTIYLGIGGGVKLPLSSVVMSPERAYDLVWEGGSIPKYSVFVFGRIKDAVKLDRVMYFDFEDEVESKPFTLVVFEDYFKHFTYQPEDVKGKDVLVYGQLRRNTYKVRIPVMFGHPFRKVLDT